MSKADEGSVPEGYEVAQTITVTVAAIMTAIETLKSRTVELHRQASNQDSSELKSLLRILADQCDEFAEEFRREARRVNRFLRHKQRKL